MLDMPIFQYCLSNRRFVSALILGYSCFQTQGLFLTQSQSISCPLPLTISQIFFMKFMNLEMNTSKLQSFDICDQTKDYKLVGNTKDFNRLD